MWSRHFIFHALTLMLISDQVFICGQAFRIWYMWTQLLNIFMSYNGKSASIPLSS